MPLLMTLACQLSIISFLTRTVHSFRRLTAADCSPGQDLDLSKEDAFISLLSCIEELAINKFSIKCPTKDQTVTGSLTGTSVKSYLPYNVAKTVTGYPVTGDLSGLGRVEKKGSPPVQFNEIQMQNRDGARKVFWLFEHTYDKNTMVVPFPYGKTDCHFHIGSDHVEPTKVEDLKRIEQSIQFMPSVVKTGQTDDDTLPAKYSGQMKVWIIQARNLPKFDIGTGKSDPYVQVKVCPTPKCADHPPSKVIWKSLNPVWKVGYEEKGDNLFGYIDDITVEVYDKDKITRDDFMGRVTITTDKSPTRRKMVPAQWFQLMNDKKEPLKNKGGQLSQIQVKVEYQWTETA